MLYFKGFTRCRPIVWHWLYKKGRKDFAYYLQSRSSAVFQTDINPAARTAAASSPITLPASSAARRLSSRTTSRSCGVTLGGTGKENEDRHPKIHHGVLIGAGARFPGNIEVGHCAHAAGSVVVKPVPQ